MKHLQPPKNQKNYLISPPSSPPKGWQPVLEEAPAINLDLLAALEKLNTGKLAIKPRNMSDSAITGARIEDEPLEVIKSTSDNIPSITVETCPNQEDGDQRERKFIPKKTLAYEFSK